MSSVVPDKVEPIVEAHASKETGPPTLAWVRASKREEDTFVTQVRLNIRMPEAYTASSSPNPGVYAADGHAVVGPVLKTKQNTTGTHLQEYAIYALNPKHNVKVRNVSSSAESGDRGFAHKVPLVLDQALERRPKTSSVKKTTMYATPLAVKDASAKSTPLTLSEWAKRGVYATAERAGGKDVAQEVEVRVRGPMPLEYAVVGEHPTSKRAHIAMDLMVDRQVLQDALPGSTLTIPICIIPLHPVIQVPENTDENEKPQYHRQTCIPTTAFEYSLHVRIPVQCTLLPADCPRDSPPHRALPHIKVPATLVIECAVAGPTPLDEPIISCLDTCRLEFKTEKKNDFTWQVTVHPRPDPRAYDTDICTLRVESLDAGSMPLDGATEGFRPMIQQSQSKDTAAVTWDTQASKICVSYSNPDQKQTKPSRYIRPIVESNPQDEPSVTSDDSPLYGQGALVEVMMGKKRRRGKAKVSCRRTLSAREGKIWVSFAFGSIPHGNIDKDRKLTYSIYAVNIRTRGPRIEVPGTDRIPVGAPETPITIDLNLNDAMELPSPTRYGCYIDPAQIPDNIDKVQLIGSVVGLGGTDYAPEEPHDETIDIPLCILEMPNHKTSDTPEKDLIRLGGWLVGTSEDGSLMFSYKRFEDEPETPRMIFPKHDTET